MLQLSMKFQLLIKLKYRQIKKFLALGLSDVVLIMLINVKIPTIVGILTFMSKINFMLKFYYLRACCLVTVNVLWLFLMVPWVCSV